MSEEKICPKCGELIIGHPAISREDNKTEICSNCGLSEAFEAFNNAISPALEGVAKAINGVATRFVESGNKVIIDVLKKKDGD